MKKQSFLILAFVLSAANAAPTNPGYVFEHYSTHDGLPHSTVTDLIRDEQGFLWITTWNGLSRFDGYTFRNFRSVPGDLSPLTNNRFFDVAQDSTGFLWLTSYDQKLFRFNRSTETFVNVLQSDPAFDGTRHKVAKSLFASNGDTWIALENEGVIRFPRQGEPETYRIDSYRENPLVGTRIEKLFEDSQHRIWAASETGITVFTPEPNDYRVSLFSTRGDAADIVEAGATLYFGMGTELMSMGIDTRRTDVREVCKKGRIVALAAAPDHTAVYIGTSENEFYIFTPRDGNVRQIRGFDKTLAGMETDSHGIVWIRILEPGIVRYHPDRGDFKYFMHPDDGVLNRERNAELIERGGTLWIKFNQTGFGHYDRQRDEIEPFLDRFTNPAYETSHSVTCFEVTPDGVVWMSTLNRGLDKFVLTPMKIRQFTPSKIPEPTETNEIRALMIDQNGNIWMGTKADELYCYDSHVKLLQKFEGDRKDLTFRQVYSLCQDSRGDIWVGSRYRGVFKLRPDVNGRFRLAAHYDHDPEDPYSLNCNAIYAIGEDALGRMWFATYGGGLNLLVSEPGPDTPTARFIHPDNGFPNYPPGCGVKARCLLSDGDNRMLAGTIEGLFVFDPTLPPDEIEFRLAQKIPGDVNSLGNNDVAHMLKDSRGRIWLSTFGGGLNLITGFDAEGAPRFRSYGERQGLSSNFLFAATEALDGSIWMSGENGISKFNPDTEKFSNYSIYDGIPDGYFSESSALTTPSGTLLFGTTRQLYIIDPHMIHSRRTDFNLTFTELEIGNREVGVGDGSPLETTISQASEIVLPHDYSVFRIEYASLNFLVQPRLRYMYIMEGFEKDWTRSGKVRSATYSNLPPGNYIFRVRCYADDDADLAEERSIAVTVRPPLWRTTIAYMFYAALFLMLIWLGLKIFTTLYTLRNRVRMEHEMSEMKLRFFTNISHELRTPLTLITGGLEEIRKHENLSPKGRSNAGVAEKNAVRMLGLINQLLDFRKIVSDKLDIQVRRTDVVSLIGGAVEDFREMAREHRIDLIASFTHRRLPAWIDPQRIESVMANLIANAFKFTPDGGRIEVALLHREGDETFTVSVADNGVGIPREKQSYVFEQFAQLRNGVRSSDRGTGIGLALAKEIVELHHGTIALESKPGSGSTFTITLRTGNEHFSMEQIDFSERDEPYDIGRASAPAERNGLQIARRTASPPPDAPHVLLVEDNCELRIFIYNQLIDSYRVTEAGDGADALERIAEDEPDIVITDLMMPVMDGIGLLEKIRENFKTSHIPIIMLTAKTAVESRIRAMRYGADDYITKPFSIELLQVRIDNLIRQRQQLFERFSAVAVSESGAAGRKTVFEVQPPEVVVTDRDEEFLREVFRWIDEHIEDTEITIDQLAAHLNLGRTTMYNKLKSLTGKPPVELIREYRVVKGHGLLKTGRVSVSEAAYKVGFSDPGYFSKCFKQKYGVSAADFLRTIHEQQNR